VRADQATQLAEIGESVATVGLHHGAELRPVGELLAERAHEREGQVLHVVVLGVEVDRGPGLARADEDRTEPSTRLGEAVGGGQWAEARRQRRRL
jgi:hypothetical protein